MHRTNALLATILSLGLLGGACTWTPEANINGGGAGGGGGYRPPGGGIAGIGVSVDGSITPTEDANCGITSQTGNRLPPDLLLVFDRSGSMAEDPTTNPAMACMPAATCPSKWNQATTAVNMAVASSAATIRWGLKLFSTPGNGGNQNNNCNVAAGAQVPIAINNAGPIATSLGGVAPGGGTPTTAAITAGGNYLNTLTTPNPRFMVLVTDGQPTCRNGNTGTGDDAAAIAAVTAQATRGFGTFVVGLAQAGNAQADATLTSMSINGLHPRTGTPNYYVVNNTAELVTALGAIGTQISSCTYSFANAPPDPTNVKVKADGATVPANDVNGWVYEAGMKAITLKGSYCQDVMNNVIKNVVILFGCAGQVIP